MPRQSRSHTYYVQNPYAIPQCKSHARGNPDSNPCSLVALQQLPLDVIKIDHRFIRDIPYNVSATDVASAVIALAHKLHLTVVAEGVETLQQLTFLKSAGCAQCQGNLFSYPLDEDALIGFLIRQYEKPLIS